MNTRQHTHRRQTVRLQHRQAAGPYIIIAIPASGDAQKDRLEGQRTRFGLKGSDARAHRRNKLTILTGFYPKSMSEVKVPTSFNVEPAPLSETDEQNRTMTFNVTFGFDPGVPEGDQTVVVQP